jgi:group I intron endonuclease
MAVGIYKITSPTGKVYIGQTRNDYLRMKSYRSIKGCHKQRKLFHSLQKHGWDAHSFQLIHELPKDVSDNALSEYEHLYWLCYMDAGFELLNLSIPGLNVRHCEESKRVMSIQRIGNKNRLGKKNIPLSEGTRKNMSRSKIGIKFSDSHKKNMSLSHPRKKRLLQFDLNGNLIKEWSSVSEAGLTLNIPKNNISRWASKTRKNTSSFLWEYKN